MVGIPAVKSYGFSGNYNIMVMELLGKSLEDLFQKSKKHFSLHTVCMIGIQMLERIKFIHNKHIIHRDIKPDNFVMDHLVHFNILHSISTENSQKLQDMQV